MKKTLLLAAVIIGTVAPAFAQRKKQPNSPVADTSKAKAPGVPGFPAPKQGPKPYKEVIDRKSVV